MIKTQNKSSFVISKTVFLDEMLPYLKTHDEDLSQYTLENIELLLELIKKLAAKVLTEQELVNILGDESKDCMWNRAKYKPNSSILTDPFQ